MFFGGMVPQTTLTPTCRHYPHHYKACCACEVQAALCHAIRGDLCTHSHLTLTQNVVNVIQALTRSPSQGRAPDASGLYDITSKWQLRKPVSHSFMHSYAYTDPHADISTRAGKIVFKTLDPVLHARHEHLIELL